MGDHGRVDRRRLGYWLAILLALSQFSNVIRVGLDAQAYSVAMGLPLDSAADVAWLHVYALRALFLVGFASVLIANRQYRALSMMALLALIMPLGDFWLIWRAGGSAPALWRQALIAAVLVAAWFSLGRMARQPNRAGPA